MIIKSEAKQTTITKKVSLTGVGLHTGKDVVTKLSTSRN